jgi:hypothetical protein
MDGCSEKMSHVRYGGRENVYLSVSCIFDDVSKGCL